VAFSEVTLPLEMRRFCESAGNGQEAASSEALARKERVSELHRQLYADLSSVRYVEFGGDSPISTEDRLVLERMALADTDSREAFATVFYLSLTERLPRELWLKIQEFF
jgi:hypothetical protein